MSRQSSLHPAQNTAPRPVPIRPANDKPSEITNPERIKYSEAPNIKGMGAAVKRIDELFGVEVTEYYLRRAITNRRLARHEICHVIHFADRELYDFIVLGTRKTDSAARTNVCWLSSGPSALVKPVVGAVHGNSPRHCCRSRPYVLASGSGLGMITAPRGRSARASMTWFL